MINLILSDDGNNIPNEKLLRFMQDASEEIIKANSVLLFGHNAEMGSDAGADTNKDADINIEISISFVSEPEIKEFNNRWRNIDSATDVLSFPQFDFSNFSDGEEANSGIEIASFETINLGDIVICTDIAEKQAEEYGHSVDREIVYLFVHSLLHLLGRDHESDAEKESMRSEEEFIMDKLDLKR